MINTSVKINVLGNRHNVRARNLSHSDLPLVGGFEVDMAID